MTPMTTLRIRRNGRHADGCSPRHASSTTHCSRAVGHRRGGPAALLAVVTAAALLVPHATAALRLVESAPGFDFNVGQSPIEIEVPFTTIEPVHGVGLTALWTAVIADDVGGAFPWSLDTSVEVHAPDGVSTLDWPVIGGDRTIADFPLADAAGGFAGVSGVGEFVWTFSQNVPPPYTMGLRDVSYHLLTFEPDVTRVWPGTTAGGPLWDRPYFIAGVSTQGPVHYHAMQFTPAVPGRYTFESVVNDTVNFNFIYRDDFDAAQPLAHLFEYGLGNGNAPNGTSPGTSLIDALLLADVTYTYVTSQWSASTPAQPFTTTVTGPAEVVAVCITCAAGDFNGDNAIDTADVAFLVDGLSGPDHAPTPTTTGASAEQCLIAFDADDDGDLDLHDFAAFARDFGGTP